MGLHSVLSPSSAARWTLCPGSVAACRGLPEDRTSVDAALGTAKHSVSERCLTEDRDPEYFVGAEVRADGHKFMFDEEMAEDVRSYVNGIRRLPGERFVEVRLDTSHVLGVPDQTGTSDAVIANLEERTLDVRDAKFGYERVMAKDNKQGIIYLAAALDFLTLFGYEFDRFRFGIHQPRIDHFDEHSYTLDELQERMWGIKAAAALAWGMYTGAVPVVLTPGPVQCKWCPIRGACPARRTEMLKMFDSEPVTPVTVLSNDEISSLLTRVGDIASWCSDIQAEAYKRAMGGQHIPGRKLIRGKKGKRFWKDPKRAEFALSQLLSSDAMYQPREIISPTAADKLLKSNFESLHPFVGQNDGALVLVPEDTPKSAVSVEPTTFEPVTENE